MTSEERHAARRARREAKRREKRMRDLAPYDNFETVADLNHLIDAARLSSRGVGRKASVQKYNMNLAWNVQETREKLLAGVDIRQGFIEFDLHERGKARHIKSMHFKERVVQRCICDRALVPILSRSLVYDNGASLAGKGTERIHPGGVRLMLNKLADKTGTFHVHPHKFRRTLATNLIRHGMPIQEVASILCHDKLDTTMQYVVLDQTETKHAYRKYA